MRSYWKSLSAAACLASSVFFTGCYDRVGPATDSGGGSGTSSTFNGAKSASNLDGNRITVTWTADSAGSRIAAYKVYTVSGNGVLSLVGTAAANSTSYVVGGLTNCTTYSLVVRTLYTDGTENSNLKVVSAMTFSGITSASVVSKTSATLTFPACTSASSLNFYCATSTGSYTLMGSTTNVSSTSYTVTGLTAATYYTCKVTAINGTGTEDTNTATAQAPICYAKPSGLVSYWDGDALTGTKRRLISWEQSTARLQGPRQRPHSAKLDQRFL